MDKYYTGPYSRQGARGLKREKTKTEYIYAYIDGTVDVYHIQDGKVQMLISLDAHGAPITKIFTIGGDYISYLILINLLLHKIIQVWGFI